MKFNWFHPQLPYAIELVVHLCFMHNDFSIWYQTVIIPEGKNLKITTVYAYRIHLKEKSKLTVQTFPHLPVDLLQTEGIPSRRRKC